MTLAEQLCGKYALTSLKANRASLALLAVNEALEAAAAVAEEENSPIAASRIRSLKWADRSIAPDARGAFMPVAKTAIAKID